MKLEFLNRGERFILDWTGILIVLISGGGLMFTFLFDQIARQESITTWGWLQVVGVLCFIALMMFGACVDMFLRQIKIILRDYMEK